MFAKKTRILLLVGLMLAVMLAPSSMAAAPDNYSPYSHYISSRPDLHIRLNSPGSVLHGRTDLVASWIMGALNKRNRRAAEQAGNSPEDLTYNQITNLSQLASIKTITGLPYSEDLNPGNYYLSWGTLEVLRAGDLSGLVNLKILGFYGLDVLEAGAFDGLPNLEILHIYIRGVRDFPAGIFDQLTNLKELHIGSHPSYDFYGGSTNASLPAGALDRLVNLESLGLDFYTIDYDGNYDPLVNLKKIEFYQVPPLTRRERRYGVVSLPPSVRTIGDYRTLYEIQEGAGSSPPPVNVGGGYVFPTLSPSPPPTVEVGQRSSDLRFTSTSLSLAEGEISTYQVRATSSPTRNMIVNIETAHTGITVNPNKLLFTPNNWQTFQTVTLTASADAADTNEQASIQHSIPPAQVLSPTTTPEVSPSPFPTPSWKRRKKNPNPNANNLSNKCLCRQPTTI